MSPPSVEIKTFFGQCKCCLNYAYLKNMWDEQHADGGLEIYGKMLVKCFSISWPANINEDDDKICEVCISKLRDAVKFKTLVLTSQKELLNKIKGKTIMEVKIEKYDEDQSDDQDSQNADENDEEIFKNSDDDEIASEVDPDNAYKDVQYLDEGLIEQDESQDADESEDYQPSAKKRKRPKKMAVNARQRTTYRKYTKETILEAVESVKSKEMTVRQASEEYNVPVRTINSALKKTTTEILNRTEVYYYVKEVKKIFSYTNVTPFKSKGNDFKCIFCPLKFRDPQELRTHTHTVHENRDKRLEFIMRPFHSFAMLRLDVEDLACNCGAKLEWSELIDHLATHEPDIDIVVSKKRLVPFKLNTTEMACLLCDFKSCYTLMDAHMNMHYKNHICVECGDSFLTLPRLQKHLKIHNVGIYPCDYCDKMFARERYRQKHTEFVHIRKLAFKCYHCDDRFATDVARRGHVEEQHSELVKPYKRCDVCNKTFSMAYFTQHLKRCTALIEHKCDECEKRFVTKKSLDEHKLRHSGVKRFQCDVCLKHYFSPAAVTMHKKYKHNKMVTLLTKGDEE